MDSGDAICAGFELSFLLKEPALHQRSLTTCTPVARRAAHQYFQIDQACAVAATIVATSTRAPTPIVEESATFFR